jgi:hypothetical protein
MRTGRLRLLTKPRLLLALALPAAVLVAVAALAAASDWWFLEDDAPTSVVGDDAPTPVGLSDVVKEGEWSGHPWQLTAYRSRTHGLCFSVTPTASKAGGSGGATSCASFVGGGRPAEIKRSREMTITLLGGAAGPELPAYVAGAVIDKASTVEIRFGTGEVLKLPTFSGQASLGRVRFYATQLPTSIPIPIPTPGRRSQNQRNFITTLAGLDSDGNVVACLASRTALHGVSPLSDCE